MMVNALCVLFVTRLVLIAIRYYVVFRAKFVVLISVFDDKVEQGFLDDVIC